MFHAQIGEGEKRWNSWPPIIDHLKDRAKKLGLRNLFLPSNHFKEGAGFTNLEYGLMAEYLGKSRTASEVRAPHIAKQKKADVYNRLPIVRRQILAIWKSWHDTVLRRRRRNGLYH